MTLLAPALVPSAVAAGSPKPAKFVLARSLSGRPLRKTLRVSGAPLAPRYSPEKGLLPEAVQLDAGFVPLAWPAAFVVNSDATPMALMLLLTSFPMKFGWLRTLNTSILSSTRIDSLLGIRKAFMTEMSKSVSPFVRPRLRPRFPLMNWKSTGSPVMLSTGPDPLAPAGASQVVCRALQFVAAGVKVAPGAALPWAVAKAPGLLHAATPAWLMARLEPAFDAILVATIAPTGAPAQPRSVEPAVQIFGRWLVSDPRAGNADPEKEPEPVETGYGRPVCTVAIRPKVQSLTTDPRRRVPVSFSVSTTKVKLAK